jgi:hypothetical protein
VVIAKPHFDRRVVPLETRAIRGAVYLENVPFPRNHAMDGVARVIDIEPIPAGVAAEGFETAEKPRFLDERTAVFRAEDIAVAALIARIGEVRELARTRSSFTLA